MTATFGAFLRPAGEHVAAAISIRDEIPAEATFGVIRQFGRLLSTLVHYLNDLPVPDEFEAAMAAEPLSTEAQTVLDARIALRRGAQSLRYAMNTLADAVIDDSHPAVALSDGEQVSGLSHGTIVTAERLRHAVLAASRARWTPTATSASWRKDALASAIIGHASELILRSLTERAKQLAIGPAICAQLQSAAKASSQAWPEWRAIAHHWNIASTGIHRGTGLTPVAAEFGDLVLLVGRLAYRNQHWTPARAHASYVRNPADLAPTLGDISSVVAAVHTAADAITRIAAGDRESVRAAAADRRLYMPAFTRTSAAVVRRRYRPASASRVDEILASYDRTIEASTRATSKLDNLAFALDASTWPLAALHAEPQRVLRAFGPRGTSVPDGSVNSPVRHRRVAARVRV